MDIQKKIQENLYLIIGIGIYLAYTLTDGMKKEAIGTIIGTGIGVTGFGILLFVAGIALTAMGQLYISGLVIVAGIVLMIVGSGGIGLGFAIPSFDIPIYVWIVGIIVLIVYIKSNKN